MNQITRNNYEAFLLDYMEQNLSPDVVAELMLFLEQNPDLQAELEEMQGFVMADAPKVVFENKQALKKNALENLMIAEIEGLNNSQESEELKQAISKDKEQEKAFLLYQKTLLKPENIVFENKSDLKQKETKVIPLYWWVSSAAAILIMFFLFRGLNNMEKAKPSAIANHQATEESIQNQSEEKKIETSVQEEIIPQNFFADNSNEEEVKKETPRANKTYNKPQPQNIPLVEEENVLANNHPVIENLMEERDSIVILPVTAIPDDELYAENSSPNLVEQPKSRLSIPEFLKKEVRERVLKDETPEEAKPTELIVANLLAKTAGKLASLDKKKNDEGEVEEYALNIGKFSFSRKIRK